MHAWTLRTQYLCGYFIEDKKTCINRPLTQEHVTFTHRLVLLVCNTCLVYDFPQACAPVTRVLECNYFPCLIISPFKFASLAYPLHLFCN